MTDIFISFKNTLNGEETEDSKFAELLYETFTEDMKYNVFMMNETLFNNGVANYKKAIDKALAEARCLIVIGSKAEFLESEWVRYEWDTYLCEILGGRKDDNICILRLNGLQIADLPIGLRKYQSFDMTQLRVLAAYVDNSLSPADPKMEQTATFVYPAVFTKNSSGYEVYFPDLDLKTDGEIAELAYLYAVELLKIYAKYVLKYKLDYNEPSDFEEVRNKYRDSCSVMLLSVDINFSDNNPKERER